MKEKWIDVVARDEVPDDDVMAANVNGTEVALYGVNGDVYATSNICSHGHARLCDGFLDGYDIECPLHQGKFDVRDGRASCEPAAEPVRSYPVKIEGGRVFVDLS